MVSSNALAGVSARRAAAVRLRRGFSLIEMLVVIGIIAILIGAGIGGYSAMTKTAEKAKTQELVSNAATALTALFQHDGVWPKRLAAEGKSDGQLKASVCLPLAKGGYLSLSSDTEYTKLTGLDRFGVVTPTAQAVLKRLGTEASLSSIVSGKTTVEDHILHYALDLDGDGIIRGASVGGESIDVRATAIVWCIGKSGGDKGQPWPYTEGLRRDDVYSWTPGQTKDVQ